MFHAIKDTFKGTFEFLHSSFREARKESTRSPKWRLVRDQFLSRNNECAACGAKNRLQVHHEKPFHLYPELELDESNLIVLCMSTNECHLRIGHGNSFRTYNPNVVIDAARFRTANQHERKKIIVEAKTSRLTD